MQTTKDEGNPNRLTSSLLKSLLWNLGLPLGIIILGLIIEYWSGWFQQPAQSTRGPLLYYYLVLFIAMMLGTSALFAIDCLKVWLRQHRYVREQFALLAFCAVISLTIVLIISMITGFMPWAIPDALIQVFRSKSIPQPDTEWTDYGFLIALYIITIWTLNQQHQSWRGLKSIEQYRREQRNEHINFFAEGLDALRRLIRREPPLGIYSELSPKQFIQQLEPVVDLLVWKDQAKELIRLSSSSYSFDSSLDWHDKENCWIGRNVDTGDLVSLYPCQGEINEAYIAEFLRYSERITKSKNERIGEIIVATRNDTDKPIKTWKGRAIRYETEASLLDHLVDFKDYFNEIRRRVVINRLPDSDLTLNDVYFPSRLFLPDGTEQNSSIEKYLCDWLIEPGQRQLALLGEYGQGKSTAALLWTYHLTNKASTSSGRIPLLIELRGTSPRNLTPLQLLGAWSAQYNINAQALMRLLISGRLILIFEGFDEMALVGDAEMRLKHFRTLWQFAYPKAKILITGRPNFFLDEEERKAALGINRPLGDRPYCEALRLAPFNPEQIWEAMRAYKSTIRDQIHELVEKNTRFRELVSRPSLLHIVAVLWERERLFDKVDQLTSAYVMDLFIRNSYRRQGLKELDSPEFMALTTLEREYFMTGIAAYMAAKQLPNQITSIQLNEVITDLINAIPEAVSTESSAISGETIQPLRRRIQGTEYGIEHVKTDVRACGLLVDDPAAPGTFRFGHKSFMEYLFAAVVAERIQNVDSEKARAVLKAANAQIEDVLLLPVAIEFLSELLVGIKRGGEAEHAAKELSITKSLFRTIMGERTFQAVCFRPAVFSEVLLHCWTKQLPPWSRTIIKLLPIFIMSIIPGLIMLLGIYILKRSKESITIHQTEYTLLLYLMAILMILATIVIKTTILPTPSVKRRLLLWNRICIEMDIQDKTLHKVVGTSLIPWIRKRPFDYYLPHESTNNGESERKVNEST
jgi:hypothetical protein